MHLSEMPVECTIGSQRKHSCSNNINSNVIPIGKFEI